MRTEACFYLSIYLSLYLPACLPTGRPASLSIYLSTHNISRYTCINLAITIVELLARISLTLSLSLSLIGLYTPINNFGRYATCSHKDGGRLHIQSRETIGQENHVTCLKLRPRVNSSPAFRATYKTRIFYKYVVFKHLCSLLPNFFAAATHSLQRKSTGEKSNTMDRPRRHSYTMTMRRFPVSVKLPVSNPKKKDIINT